MDPHPVPETRVNHSIVGKFIRRLIWRHEAGPLSAEARVEIRELDTEPRPRHDDPR